jgi:hypothetical protein
VKKRKLVFDEKTFDERMVDEKGYEGLIIELKGDESYQ